MDIIEISSDSESDCVVGPQPPPKRSWKTAYKSKVREARSEIFAEESLSLQQKRKLTAERSRDLRVAAQRKRHQEQKQMQRQRQEAARETNIEVAVAMLSDAGGESASESSNPQLWQHDVPSDALVESCNLPFPMADSLPSCNHAAPAASPPSTDRQPETAAVVALAREPFPQDPTSPTVAQGETLAPACSDLEEENPGLPSHGVSDPSGDAALQHMSPRRSAAQTAIHQTSRRLKETRRENAAPTATPLRAVMLHWGRLWQHPRHLYQYWLSRPLFRRAQPAGGQGNTGGLDGTFTR
ncbi:hypothetical protein LMH87_010179 [Akanthomyces muscarius]|uniref:Uncharacterized protein n=1 Tax=Akanthomyces muscarius TaxID=2231603 RepID=A0A9W8QDN4_AKAMU|nr:hypothetical protein LMH87_010179 [Akanthomyces muscarius]KAJ4153705.1 hypothetical protein LMH87_010179 [Akanthomyces muscarius]